MKEEKEEKNWFVPLGAFLASVYFLCTFEKTFNYFSNATGRNSFFMYLLTSMGKKGLLIILITGAILFLYQLLSELLRK